MSNKIFAYSVGQLLRRKNWKERKLSLLFYVLNIPCTNTTYTITESSSLNKAVHVPLHMRTVLNNKVLFNMELL
jgi:hypothetical protein